LADRRWPGASGFSELWTSGWPEIVLESLQRTNIQLGPHRLQPDVFPRNDVGLRRVLRRPNGHGNGQCKPRFDEALVRLGIRGLRPQQQSSGQQRLRKPLSKLVRKCGSGPSIGTPASVRCELRISTAEPERWIVSGAELRDWDPATKTYVEYYPKLASVDCCERKAGKATVSESDRAKRAFLKEKTIATMW
jgi:hypothetical protein